MANDMEINDDNIITVLLSLMEEVEKLYVLKSGADKKVFVLGVLKERLGTEQYERYYPLLNLTIDFIVEISRGNILLHLNKVKNKFCCF